MATTASTQTLTNKTIDATDGTNSVTVTNTEYIRIQDWNDGLFAPEALSRTCNATVQPEQFRIFAADADDDVTIGWNAPHDLDVTSLKVRLVLGRVDAEVPTADTDDTYSFGLSGCSVGNADIFRCTFGAADEIEDDDFENASTICDVIYTSQITLDGITGLAAGEMVRLLLFRDVDGAASNHYAEDIAVYGVILEYKLVKENTY
jgi:hypothetical protein